MRWGGRTGGCLAGLPPPAPAAGCTSPACRTCCGAAWWDCKRTPVPATLLLLTLYACLCPSLRCSPAPTWPAPGEPPQWKVTETWTGGNTRWVLAQSGCWPACVVGGGCRGCSLIAVRPAGPPQVGERRSAGRRRARALRVWRSTHPPPLHPRASLPCRMTNKKKRKAADRVVKAAERAAELAARRRMISSLQQGAAGAGAASGGAPLARPATAARALAGATQVATPRASTPGP